MKGNVLFLWAAFIGGGFCLGGIMFSQIIPGIFLKKDIRMSSPDRNPGAANVFTLCGIPLGLLCLFLDMLKGFLPVFAASKVLDIQHMLFAAILTSPVLGHAIAPFNHFHGGKCIAAAFGVMLALLPVTPIVLVLAGLYIFFSVIVKIKSKRLRSIVTFGLFGSISAFIFVMTGRYPLAVGCASVSLIAIAKHTKYFSFVPQEELKEGAGSADALFQRKC